MAWVRIDDSLADDPRIATAGAMAAGVLALSLCYSNRNLTDGWVPVALVRRWLFEGNTSEAAGEAETRLLQVCLLAPVEQDGVAGYQIHRAYVSLQPSRAQVLEQRDAKRQQKADAGRLGGVRSGEVRRKQTRSNAAENAKQLGSISVAPVPDPDPDSEMQTKSISAEMSSAPFLVFPVVGPDGPMWTLFDHQVAEWDVLFLNVDVRAEARQALAWLQASPQRQKTAKGMKRFLVGWFGRAVDRRRSLSPAPTFSLLGRQTTRLMTALESIRRAEEE